MNNFLKGLLVGTGVGLLVAPLRGEEMRRRIADFMDNARSYLPENEQMHMYTQQVSDRVAQTSDTLKEYAQHAASTMKDTASNLGNVAQGAASTVKRGGKDSVDTVRRTFDQNKDKQSNP